MFEKREQSIHKRHAREIKERT